MEREFEYKFVRLGEGWLSARSPDKTGYQQVIHEHAAQGWRLVQIFSPGVGAYGASLFHELIFERCVGAGE